MKIALPKEYLGEGIDPEVKETILNAAKHFEKLGAIVEEVSLPHSKYGVAVYYIIASSEASSISSAVATPSPRMKIASLIIGINTRFTTKP